MNKSVILNNGVEMPLLGLGTYQMTAEECAAAIPAAWKSGYRLFDTAAVYQNEQAVATALSQCASEDHFVTSKLGARDQGAAKAPAALQRILANCGGKVDLLLMHWPGASGLQPEDHQNAVLRRESWLLMEQLYRDGRVRSIGVSNFEVCHLEELLSYASVKPVVNQIELHPLYHRKDVVDCCHQHGILVQAYSSLARNKLLSDAIVSKHRILQELPGRTGKTLAQCLLRWALQHGYAIIPKSVHPGRIAENGSLFDFALSDADMSAIDALYTPTNELQTCWNPRPIV